MTYSAEERALVWLCACTDLDLKTRAALLREAGSAVRLFENFEEFSASVIENRADRVCNKGGLPARRKELESMLALMEKSGIFAVTAESEDFPAEAFRQTAPPLVLFGSGRRELLSARKFCVVGSRVTPPWAEKLGREIAETLSEKFVIVTGLAEGGDCAAIRGALPGGNLICVLPCGINECYPAAHASLKREIGEKGLLLSEYPPDAKVGKGAFHARNRILAALSEGTLVLSAGERSGALITADYAVDFGKYVFALPYNPGIAQGKGCNELIKNFAYLCTDASDILSCFGMEAGKKEAPALSEGEERVRDVLLREGELHAAVIAERLLMPAYEAAAVLAALELKGLVAKTGGNRYAIVK